ncbi:MAG: helix-turn-helix domain-containing protein, partial [bacterium]|nr:helix-turn-helix domain-containing protein [bacterium]
MVSIACYRAAQEPKGVDNQLQELQWHLYNSAMDEHNNQDQQYPSNSTNTATTESVGNSPLPHSNVSDTKPTKVSDNVGQRPTQVSITSDSVGQRRTEEPKDVGHDPDLPHRDVRHALTTYEAARIFEEAECRVSERTVIRWCNTNKRGTRRLDCAFEPDERKYYISEESVKDVIREERTKGRQSETFNPDLSDVEEVSDESDRHDTENGGQRRTVSDESVGHKQNMSDTVRQEEPTPKVEQDTNYVEQQNNDHTTLQIQVATLEEQAKTKDEMMTFLR